MSMVKDFKRKVIENLENNWTSDNEELNFEAANMARQDFHENWNENLIEFGDNIQGVHNCAKFYRYCIRNLA